MTDNVLQQLDAVLRERRESGDPDSSYVAKLHAAGLNKILEKIGEEATETILAAKDAEAGGDNKDLIAETADLWFHTLVMLSHLELDHSAVEQELARRFGLSGLDEKAARSK